MVDNIPIVEIDFFGANLSIDIYANNAFEWAKINLVSQKQFFCPCLNADVQVSNKGIKHTIYQKKWDQQGNYNQEIISLISVLPELLNQAEVRYSAPDRYGSENIKYIKMLKASVNINGGIKEVELLIKEVYVNKQEETTCHIFYNHIFV